MWAGLSPLGDRRGVQGRGAADDSPPAYPDRSIPSARGSPRVGPGPLARDAVASSSCAPVTGASWTSGRTGVSIPVPPRRGPGRGPSCVGGLEKHSSFSFCWDYSKRRGPSDGHRIRQLRQLVVSDTWMIRSP